MTQTHRHTCAHTHTHTHATAPCPARRDQQGEGQQQAFRVVQPTLYDSTSLSYPRTPQPPAAPTAAAGGAGAGGNSSSSSSSSSAGMWDSGKWLGVVCLAGHLLLLALTATLAFEECAGWWELEWLAERAGCNPSCLCLMCCAGLELRPQPSIHT